MAHDVELRRTESALRGIDETVACETATTYPSRWQATIRAPGVVRHRAGRDAGTMQGACRAILAPNHDRTLRIKSSRHASTGRGLIRGEPSSSIDARIAFERRATSSGKPAPRWTASQMLDRVAQSHRQLPQGRFLDRCSSDIAPRLMGKALGVEGASARTSEARSLRRMTTARTRRASDLRGADARDPRPKADRACDARGMLPAPVCSCATRSRAFRAP